MIKHAIKVVAGMATAIRDLYIFHKRNSSERV